MEVTNLLSFSERSQLRAWFEANHQTEACCWVACNRSKQPKPEDEGGGGSFGGGGGGAEPENFEMYELDETELMKVIPQNQMTVQVSIDELDILSVAQGQTAEITVDALPGRAFYGNVSRINPIGENNGGNTRYTITITIDKDENMLPGMNATAILTVGQTENVLTIPSAALCQRGSKLRRKTNPQTS